MNWRALIIVLLFCIPGLDLYSQDSSIVETPTSVDPEPVEKAYVIFEGDTLFSINSDLGPYSASERAALVMHNLDLLITKLEFVEDSFNITHKETFSIIDYKGIVIISVNDDDIIGIDKSRQEVAGEYKETIYTAFQKHFTETSFVDWLYRVGMTLLLLTGLILIFYLLNRSFKWISNRLIKYEKSLKRKRRSFFRYLAPRGPEHFFTFLIKIIKYAIFILILFLYLPLLFSFFPWSQHLVHQFYIYISEPVFYVIDGLYGFLDNLVIIVIIIMLARYLVRILKLIGREIEQEKLNIKGFHKDWAKPTTNILKFIIYAFALVFLFPYLPGSGSPAFQGVSIFLGILLSLGSTSAIANIVAGIVITYMRPFVIGDRVRIGETLGDVVEKTLLVTKIRTIKNEDVTIPNATIINTHLWNFTKNAKEIGVILHTSVTIGYDVPWQTVNKLLLLAAKNTENLSRDPKPFVLQKSLNDFYVEYELNVYTKQPAKMMIFYSELHKHILEAFNEAGVEILSPHYNSLRDGNPSTIQNTPDTRNPVEKIIDKATGK